MLVEFRTSLAAFSVFTGVAHWFVFCSKNGYYEYYEYSDYSDYSDYSECSDYSSTHPRIVNPDRQANRGIALLMYCTREYLRTISGISGISGRYYIRSSCQLAPAC